MAISKVKLPDNSIQDIKDSRIPAAASGDNSKVLSVTDTSGTLGWVAQVSLAVSKTYSELKTLRDGGTLVPNTLYRITDYVTTTVDTESRSMEHSFDILVRAIDASHLSEEAGACLHSGDSYFANTKFTAWKVWYCLDNDTTRFTWADTTNGKGVIYRMIDEWNNDVPYDFKNIQFKRYKVTAQTAYSDALSVINGLYVGLQSTYSKGLDTDTSDYKWYYTFSRTGDAWATDVTDDSLTGKAANNVFKAPEYTCDQASYLANLVFTNGAIVNTFLKSIGTDVSDGFEGAQDNYFEENIVQISAFGTFCNNFGESQFRRNIVVGRFRHNTTGSDVQDNTIATPNDFCFNRLDSYCADNIIFGTKAISHNKFGYFVNNIIKASDAMKTNEFNDYFQNNTFTITSATSSNSFFGYFSNNTFFGSSQQSFFRSYASNSTFGTQQNPARFGRSVFGGIYNSIIDAAFYDSEIGYTSNCELHGPIAYCTFRPYLQYVTIPAVTNQFFAGIDIKGLIRGTSSATITLGAPQFYLASVGNGVVSRRVNIEGDTTGAIVATWKGTDGKQTGIRSTDNGSTWTALESIAYTSDITDVEANPTVPSGTTPTTLTGMKVGSNYYSVSSGGGGGGNYAGSPSDGGPANKTLAIPFGSVDSTSTSLVYTATVDNFPTTLSNGVCAYIKNGVVTSESGFTLNINNTGDLPVYQTQADATRVTTAFNINYTFLFVYNSSRVEGGCWDMYYGYTTSLAQTVRTAQVSRTTTAKTYRYRLLFSSADDTQWVPANTSSSTNSTASRSANQTPINPWGDIRYYNYTTAVNADSSFSSSYLYEQTGITLGYSFNTTGAALTLTSKAPVYIKCAPQSNGSAIIDSTTPYTQALPATDDGKIYIYLGVAYSATAVELVPYHPVYCYKDGAIRLWTNELSNDTKVLTTNPAGGFVPNVMYNLGTLTGSVTFALASPTDNTIVNHYYWTFTADSTAPTITWPSGISWFGGSAPVIAASKHYDVSVLDNIAVCMEV